MKYNIYSVSLFSIISIGSVSANAETVTHICIRNDSSHDQLIKVFVKDSDWAGPANPSQNFQMKTIKQGETNCEPETLKRTSAEFQFIIGQALSTVKYSKLHGWRVLGNGGPIYGYNDPQVKSGWYEGDYCPSKSIGLSCSLFAIKN